AWASGSTVDASGLGSGAVDRRGGKGGLPCFGCTHRDATMKIQLLTFPGCPNAAATREVLGRVLAATKVRAPIEDVNIEAPETPETMRAYASPTILIDGAPVGGPGEKGATSCRVYRDASGQLSGVPPEAEIRAGLQAAQSRSRR